MKIDPVAPGGQVEPIITTSTIGLGADQDKKNDNYDAEMVTDIPQDKECG